MFITIYYYMMQVAIWLEKLRLDWGDSGCPY
jgi:hypothetical protein